MQWNKLVDASVVHQDIDATKSLLSLRKQAFNFRFLSHVRPHGDCLSILLCNFVHNAIGSFLTGRIVGNHGGAFGSEMLRYCSANSF